MLTLRGVVMLRGYLCIRFVPRLPYSNRKQQRVVLAPYGGGGVPWNLQYAPTSAEPQLFTWHLQLLRKFPGKLMSALDTVFHGGIPNWDKRTHIQSTKPRMFPWVASHVDHTIGRFGCFQGSLHNRISRPDESVDGAVSGSSGVHIEKRRFRYGFDGFSNRIDNLCWTVFTQGSGFAR